MPQRACAHSHQKDHIIYLVAARMVDTAGGATRASASAAIVVFASWCSRRSADPPISSASEGLPPPFKAPGNTEQLNELSEQFRRYDAHLAGTELLIMMMARSHFSLMRHISPDNILAGTTSNHTNLAAPEKCGFFNLAV